MNILPEYFSPDGLSAAEARKFEYFYEQFVLRNFETYGMGHFVLACYAALPAVLTPDLVHKLWLNFKNYAYDGKTAVIQPVAPVDLLLSPLVEEMGSELYEMSEPIRKTLLLYVKEVTTHPEKSRLQLFRLEEVAEFLRDFSIYDFTPAHAEDYAFREAQQWTAMSYLDPGRAFAEVTQAFLQASSKAGKARCKDAIEKMSARFALNIVKEGAEVPKDHKAVTALTSVIRDVLQQRAPKKLEELKQEALVRKDLLTDVPIRQSNVINIEVPETVAKLVQETESTTDRRTRKLKALIVGVGEEHESASLADVNSARLLADVFTDSSLKGHSDLVSITGVQATKEAILKEWNRLVAHSKEHDDLLLYIAANAKDIDGHCCIICSDAGNPPEVSMLLRDEEIGAIAKTGHYASLTMILQVDHTATPYWLDISIPKHIVFASSQYEQPATWFTVNAEGGPYCAFTYVLMESLREHGMHVSNRDLFIDALKRYDDLPWTINVAGHNWQYKAPQLIGNLEAYDRIFLRGKNYTAALQNLLRQAGYYDGKTTGRWELETAVALESYCSTASLSTSLSKTEYIEHLKGLIEERRGVHKPVFLLVFADPQQLFPGMKEERREILEALSDTESKMELIVLDDPDRETIKKTFQDKANRDRIELFYYSGGDDQGDMVFKDGVWLLFEFAALLQFQSHLSAVISNTCRSEHFADYATQLGVGIAYGITGTIATTLCEELGALIFNRIREGEDLLAFPDLLKNIRSRTNESFHAFQLYKAHWYDAGSKVSWDLGLKDVHDTELVSKEEVYAIIVGIGAYRDSSFLEGAEEDAHHFLSWLIEKGVPEYNIKMITPVPEVMVQGHIDEAIISVINQISENTELHGRLIFYVTGKGVADANNVLFCLPGISSVFRNAAINLNAYFSALSAVPNFKEILFFYDLEEMGELGIHGLTPTFVFPSERRREASSSYMMGQLFSNSSHERMEGRQRGHFTQMLIRGLNGAAADQEGNVTARSLRLFMIDAMPNMRATHSGERDFVIAVNRPKP